MNRYCLRLFHAVLLAAASVCSLSPLPAQDATAPAVPKLSLVRLDGNGLGLPLGAMPRSRPPLPRARRLYAFREILFQAF